MSSRAAEKERARAERVDTERRAAEADRRRRRLIQVGVVALAAGLILLALILVSQAGDDSGGPVEGGSDVAALFAGIPQQGNLLGDPEAEGSMSEFADLQCPFCADYANDVLPGVISRYVRPGRVQLELNLVAIIGPDSERAARAAIAAGRQDKMWEFSELFYRNQGIENSGYVDEGFIRDVAEAVPGLDADRVLSDMDSAGVTRTLARMESQAQRLGVSGTPTFFTSRRGGEPRRLTVQALELDAFTPALDSIAGQ